MKPERDTQNVYGRARKTQVVVAVLCGVLILAGRLWICEVAICVDGFCHENEDIRCLFISQHKNVKNYKILSMDLPNETLINIGS